MFSVMLIFLVNVLRTRQGKSLAFGGDLAHLKLWSEQWIDSFLSLESSKLQVTVQSNLMAHRKTAEQLNFLADFCKDMHNENHVCDVRGPPRRRKKMPKQQQRCGATLGGEMQKHAGRKLSCSEMQRTTPRRCCKDAARKQMRRNLMRKMRAREKMRRKMRHRCCKDKMRYDSGRFKYVAKTWRKIRVLVVRAVCEPKGCVWQLRSHPEADGPTWCFFFAPLAILNVTTHTIMFLQLRSLVWLLLCFQKKKKVLRDLAHHRQNHVPADLCEHTQRNWEQAQTQWVWLALQSRHASSLHWAQRESYSENLCRHWSPLSRSRFHHRANGNLEHEMLVGRLIARKPARIKPCRISHSSKQTFWFSRPASPTKKTHGMRWYSC